MIFHESTIAYFNAMKAKVSKGMVLSGQSTPYEVVDEPILREYECLREVWRRRVPVKRVCARHGVSRSTYYGFEGKFLRYGVCGLFMDKCGYDHDPKLEELVLLIKKARPAISRQGVHRIVNAVPAMDIPVDEARISQVLASHGRGVSNMDSDIDFWERLQRVFKSLERTRRGSGNAFKRRSIASRKETFFIDADTSHLRLELMRELALDRRWSLGEHCQTFGVSLSCYYRLAEDYTVIGPWAVVPAPDYGKSSLNPELELRVILEKLGAPALTSGDIAARLKLKISRFAVNRVLSKWGLRDQKRKPVFLDRHIGKEVDGRGASVRKAACNLIQEKDILECYRINRHFELISDKMRRRPIHVCNPGPLILAPFVNDLGIIQALESFGPEKRRGEEMTNPALLNIFRILGGYRRISHLRDGSDKSVAFASGVGVYGSNSKYYKDSGDHTFEELCQLRLDLAARGRELGLTKGVSVATDFHFKTFTGGDASDKNIRKGPDKKGDLVPGFRPHVAWDVDANTILTLSYFNGNIRGTKILEDFCERNIFPIFDREAIRELYVDSEYTKEKLLGVFKTTLCPGGDVFICLKKNKRVLKIIEPALRNEKIWEPYGATDEIHTLRTTLPETGLPFTIVILRNASGKDNVRCFGSTRENIPQEDLLEKYRNRWFVENGLKDLVHSYFVDETPSTDPERIEFNLYCVMAARLAFEYFLKEMGEGFHRKFDGNKMTLDTMRNILLARNNCEISKSADGNYLLTFLDSSPGEVGRKVAETLVNFQKKGKNRVLWWNNRGISVTFRNQFDF